jgi:hypothetical protein
MLQSNYAHRTAAKASTIVAVSILMTTLVGPARSDDASAESKSKEQGALSLFPAVFYTPESSLVLGAMAMYAFRSPGSDPGSRRSGLPIFAAYTLKNQFIAAARPNIYLNGEQWNIEGNIEASHFPDTVYPDGQNSRNVDDEKFISRRIVFESAVTGLLWRRLRVGLGSVVRHISISQSEPDGIISTGTLAGAGGGFRVGAGPVLVWDNRDNNFTTYSGGRHKVSATFFSKRVGSENNFSVYEIDSRQFFTVAPGHVIGVQGFGHFGAGDQPFDMRGRIGGPFQLRGFFEGRFADRHLVSAQTQYSFPLASWLRLAVFAGLGQVAGNLNQFSGDRFVFAAGGGPRFSLNKQDRVNLRIDIAATSTGDIYPYFHMIEAF